MSNFQLLTNVKDRHQSFNLQKYFSANYVDIMVFVSCFFILPATAGRGIRHMTQKSYRNDIRRFIDCDYEMKNI